MYPTWFFRAQRDARGCHAGDHALANVEWTKYGMAKSKPAKSGLNIMFGE